MISSMFRAWDKERVVTYTVHECGQPVADRIDRAEELTFVKDGFNYAAAVFGPFWLLANGLWLALIGYVAIGTAIALGMDLVGIGGVWPVLFFAGLHLLIGAEADSLKRFALEQSGWRAVGTVVGRNASECERRFFETWLTEQPLLLRDTAGHGPAGLAPAGNVAHGRASSSGAGLRGRGWWPFGKSA